MYHKRVSDIISMIILIKRKISKQNFHLLSKTFIGNKQPIFDHTWKDEKA